jgi:hypothetical protein
VRFREDKPEHLERARVEIAAWRDLNPQGTADQLIAEIGDRFHKDYGPVLRSVLITVDRHRARQITGISGETAR